jgi:hypothetical protein
MNRTPEIIAELRRELLAAPVADLPAAIANLEGVKAEAWMRLIAPAQAVILADGDDWLTVDQAAEFLKTSARWVRDHRKELKASSLPGRGEPRFSRHTLNLFMKRRVG